LHAGLEQQIPQADYFDQQPHRISGHRKYHIPAGPAQRGFIEFFHPARDSGGVDKKFGTVKHILARVCHEASAP